MPSPEFLTLQQAIKGRYSLDREIGRGGMGIVFLARDVALDRLVAIKLLRPDLATDAAVRERFLREARTAAALSHPNIVPIHAVEDADGLVFFVMSYVDGETLGTRVRAHGPLSAAETMRTVQETAWGLAHAHARGVIHRDIKPDNVLLDRDTGRVLLTDFGIARSATGRDTPPSGSVVGTPQYMSPEQSAGGPVDARSDLYSLGVTAFFAATGRLPFDSASAAGFLVQHATATAPLLGPLAPKLPARFSQVIDRCLAKNPDARPTSCDELAREIGAARGAIVRMPAPLLHFIRDAQAVGSEAGGYLAGLAGIVLAMEAYKLIDGDWFGIVTAFEVLAVALIAGLSATRLAQLVTQARDLLHQGYHHPALRAALELDEREIELTHTESDKPSTLGNWLTAAAGSAAMGIGLLAMSADADLVVVLGTATAIGAPLVTVRRLWERLGGARLFTRLLKGRMGRAVFRMAGIGMKDTPATAPAEGERTELALGRALDKLFQALPERERMRLAQVPSLIAKLEADAMDIRTRSGDPRAERRLADTVAALETLRLDLLRLHAGQLTLDELTLDLERVREVGEEVDRRVDAGDEVAHTLGNG